MTCGSRSGSSRRALMLTAVALLSCGKHDRPPVYMEPVAPGLEAGGAGGSGGEGAGGESGEAAVEHGQYDPDQVYILGTLAEGSCGADAFAHWSNPNSGATGFSCNVDDFMLDPQTGRLVFRNRSGEFDDYYAFVPDAYDRGQDSFEYPTSPHLNDIPVETACTSGQVFMDPQSGSLLRWCCIEQPCRYLWPDGSEFSLSPLDYTIRHLGYDGSALLDREVLAPDGTISEIEDPTLSLDTVRAHEGGFRVFEFVDGGDFPDYARLHQLNFDGSIDLVGQYPEAPADVDVHGWSCALEKSDAFLCQGSDRNVTFGDLIVRGELDGETTVVYTEVTEPPPLVKLHISYLVTAP